MKRLVILGLTLIGAACASGRLACRVEGNPYPSYGVCYVEQDLLTLGPFVLSAGVEARSPDRLTPYLLLGWFERKWWATLELARSLTGQEAWRWSVAGGYRW